MTLILMNIQYIKAYTYNYIWLIRTNEDNLLIEQGKSLKVQEFLSKTSKYSNI